MEIIKTLIEGLVIIQPKVFEDERGYFMESYKELFIKENFPDIHFIQDNESKSSYGVLRGLHFQKPPFVAPIVPAVSVWSLSRLAVAGFASIRVAPASAPGGIHDCPGRRGDFSQDKGGAAAYRWPVD